MSIRGARSLNLRMPAATARGDQRAGQLLLKRYFDAILRSLGAAPPRCDPSRPPLTRSPRNLGLPPTAEATARE